MFQNAIDYNEWKNGERKESVAFSWRPLDAKFSSATLKGVQNLTFIIAGLYYTVISPISSAEGKLNSGWYNTSEAVGHTFEGDITAIMGNVQPYQLATMGYIVIGVIILVFTAAYCCLHFGYKVGEEEYSGIVKELDIRHAKNQAEAQVAKQ